MTAEALFTILAMAAVTYGIRAGGLLLAERLPSTGFVALWLKHIPGAVLAALVAPAIANGGPEEWIAAACAALAYAVARNILVTIMVGVLAVVVARHLLGG
jgi:uncharacterized membrane protein